MLRALRTGEKLRLHAGSRRAHGARSKTSRDDIKESLGDAMRACCSASSLYSHSSNEAVREAQSDVPRSSSRSTHAHTDRGTLHETVQLGYCHGTRPFTSKKKQGSAKSQLTGACEQDGSVALTVNCADSEQDRHAWFIPHALKVCRVTVNVSRSCVESWHKPSPSLCVRKW